MTNLEDAYLRANINLADTLAEALISDSNQEKAKPRYSIDPGGKAKKEAERLAAQRRNNPETMRRANAAALKAHAIANQPMGGVTRVPGRPGVEEANEMLGACIAEGLAQKLRSVASKMKDRYQKGSKKSQARGMEKADRESEKFHADRKRRERGTAYSQDS